MSDRALQLAAYVRRLSDHNLNDLLVELPRERFTPLAEAALARPFVLDAVAISFQRTQPRQGEVTRWDVLIGGPGRRIGAVARRTWLMGMVARRQAGSPTTALAPSWRRPGPIGCGRGS